MSPFDRALTTSYSPFIQTMRLFCVPFSRYSELSKFSYPRVFGAHVGGDPAMISSRSLASKKLESLVYCVAWSSP